MWSQMYLYKDLTHKYRKKHFTREKERNNNRNIPGLMSIWRLVKHLWKWSTFAKFTGFLHMGEAALSKHFSFDSFHFSQQCSTECPAALLRLRLTTLPSLERTDNDPRGLTTAAKNRLISPIEWINVGQSTSQWIIHRATSEKVPNLKLSCRKSYVSTVTYWNSTEIIPKKKPPEVSF